MSLNDRSILKANDDLSVTYTSSSGKPVNALAGINLNIKDGEFVTIIGPSGCGKSTLLQCFGGLLSPTIGEISVDNKPLVAADPKLAAFVFQEYTLLPWKNIVDNVSIGLHWAGESKEDCLKKGLEMLELVGLSEVAKSYPRELSGGMQQRVAVARAMSMDPSILLMDEPFGALDEQTRRHLGWEVCRILTARGRTVVMVTHSLDEAIIWADRIIVLSECPGRIINETHVPTPRPRPLAFIGTPAFAEIRAELFRLLETSSENVQERVADSVVGS